MATHAAPVAQQAPGIARPIRGDARGTARDRDAPGVLLGYAKVQCSHRRGMRWCRLTGAHRPPGMTRALGRSHCGADVGRRSPMQRTDRYVATRMRRSDITGMAKTPVARPIPWAADRYAANAPRDNTWERVIGNP
jgi:hypothetical protein